MYITVYTTATNYCADVISSNRIHYDRPFWQIWRKLFRAQNSMYYIGLDSILLATEVLINTIETALRIIAAKSSYNN